MLKLDDQQYGEALERVTAVLCLFDSNETYDGGMIVARAVMEALAADFDVSPLDLGPDNDVAEGNVWPRESDEHLARRAFGVPHRGARSWI